MIKTCLKLLRYGLKVQRVDSTSHQIKNNLKIDFVALDLCSFLLSESGNASWAPASSTSLATRM